jgi:hypothetical protein
MGQLPRRLPLAALVLDELLAEALFELARLPAVLDFVVQQEELELQTKDESEGEVDATHFPGRRIAEA